MYEEDFKREREDREKATGQLEDEQTMKTNLLTQLDFVSNEMQGCKTSNEQLKREKAHLEMMLADHQYSLAAVEMSFQRSQGVSEALTRKLQGVEFDLEVKTREAELTYNVEWSRTQTMIRDHSTEQSRIVMTLRDRIKVLEVHTALEHISVDCYAHVCCNVILFRSIYMTHCYMIVTKSPSLHWSQPWRYAYTC